MGQTLRLRAPLWGAVAILLKSQEPDVAVRRGSGDPPHLAVSLMGKLNDIGPEARFTFLARIVESAL